MADLPRINDYPVGEHFEVFVLIKNAELKTDRNGNNYLAFTFQDKSGSINGMHWNVTDRDIEQFKPGAIVRLKGYRELYNGNPQARIQDMRLKRPDEAKEIADFLEDAPEPKDEMMVEFKKYLQAITNDKIQAIVRDLLNQNAQAFFDYPAAKTIHHAYPGGLAFHTLSILHLCEAVVNQYEGINQSLLYGGAILHDMAKVIEFSDPLTAEYTFQGKLIGHISLIAEKVSLTAEKLGYDQDDEAVVLLKHMVLAHHGKHEYGSPVLPQLMEAEILHHIDDLDADMNQLLKAKSQTEPGEFSQRLFAMGNRAFYRPSNEFNQR
ncbi:MAG: HD domain-containing protein [Aerococcus sp.]|nr:HD domain-containing protein [Aerococcus sp.]